MGKISKTLAVLLTLFITMLCLTLLTIIPANAQTLPEPSVPEFTIQIQNQANKTTITLTIRNQPFDAVSQYPNGFFYNVAISVDGKSWSDLYHVEDASDWYPKQSNSSTTVLTYVAGETMYYPINTSQGVGVIPESGEVAFRVQAMIGHRDRGAFQDGFMPYVLVGEESDWSDTQTIVIPTIPTTPSVITPSNTPTSTDTSLNETTYLLIISVTLLAIAILLAVIIALLFIRKNRKLVT